MDEARSSILPTAVLEYLDLLDRLVAQADERSRVALADTEVTRLAAAWRALLALHQADERGRCPQCSGWRRGRKFPCSVWVVAHVQLIGADRLSTQCGADRRTTTSERPIVSTPSAC